MQIGVPDLRSVFFLGEFEFEDDGPCEMVGDLVRRALHEGALEAARAHGAVEYLRFYTGAEIDAGTPTPLDVRILTAEDVKRLASYLQALECRGIDSVVRERFTGW